MKILVSDKIADSAIEGIKSLGHDVTVKTGMSSEELETVIPEFECIIVRSATKVRKPIIDVAKNLKLIIRGGVGLDNIDVDYAKSKGIEVKNTPAASSISVAELTIGHLLAVARHIPYGTMSLKNGKWEKKSLKGIELYKKTLGIIGFGRIGRELAKRALGFDMNVIAYDPFVKETDMNVKLVELNELLKTADFISMHLPHTDQTHHMISKEQFDMMKDGAIFVNCARGGVVNEVALYEALKSGKLYGAALDVFEKEPPESSPLFDFNNFNCTPHLGATTKEGQDRVGDEIIKILKNY
ncbi:3-phosphoglycerate dehydrogenase [candidate division WOR-3 bacterium]|uniref:3-phosphoglycerate dehydrogenase n=1 Tax=candidate division TA06 bacterium TaxID=2250710 RepID=A0A660S9K3_UNCT6|nr:3-phosphoglycerate dehydrogenase [candidate division WOR-3 bacterium]RKX67361.1 MAG: 3-phosphoglycerate dehydrogenase [candidate division TA06 bacterium]